eukprot:TRINITY_DN2319_c0_g1_i1.p4 TRINITY_DN2319_c0_g1~~TRINITY_DN2319_c0_g1_i1.p4  ORF type:complete len:114 (+),score=33.96 TRINITY_DN2319_c0_g1_i1:1714-2055(+)
MSYRFPANIEDLTLKELKVVKGQTLAFQSRRVSIEMAREKRVMGSYEFMEGVVELRYDDYEKNSPFPSFLFKNVPSTLVVLEVFLTSKFRQRTEKIKDQLDGRVDFTAKYMEV